MHFCVCTLFLTNDKWNLNFKTLCLATQKEVIFKRVFLGLRSNAMAVKISALESAQPLISREISLKKHF